VIARNDTFGMLAKVCAKIFFTLFFSFFESPAVLQNDQAFSHS